MMNCELCGKEKEGWMVCKGKNICRPCREIFFNDGQDDIFYMGQSYRSMLAEYHVGLAYVQMQKGINIFNVFEKYDDQDFFIQQCPKCHNHFSFTVQFCYLCGTKVGITRLDNSVRFEICRLQQVKS